MKQDHVRVAVDIPKSLYRRLEKLSRANNQTIPDLILAGVQKVLPEERQRTGSTVKFPLLGSDGPKIDLTNEKIYKLVDFP
jgi:hypothetical protein